MKNIKNFFSKFWKKKNKVLFKTAKNKNFFQKRNSFKLKFNFKKPNFAIKKTYIPYLFLAWFFLILVILFIVFWPIFRVENIQVSKKDPITNIDIIYKSLDDFRWESIFNMEKSTILQRIQDYQENIKDINLKIKFPKSLNISAESFKEIFNVNINSRNYILLANGSLIPTINAKKDLPTLEIIKIIDKNRILEYKKIFDEKYILKIEKLLQKVKENIAGIKITAMKYYENQREFHIILNDFTRLIFSLDDSISIDEQIKNLAILDREKSQISNNDKVYIDLRIIWKVFFCSIEWQKWKEKENQCIANLENIYNKL